MKTSLCLLPIRVQSRLLLRALLWALLIGVALLFRGANVARAAPVCTINWTGGGPSTSWFAAANWDQNHVPTTSDNVCIPVTNPAITVAVDQNQTAQVLTLQSEEAVEVSSGALTLTDTTETSTIGSGLTWSGGTLGGAGDVVVAGPVSWSGGTKAGAGTLTANGGMTISGTDAKFIAGGTVTNPAGQTAVINGAGAFDMTNGGSFTNEGTVDDQVDLAFYGGFGFPECTTPDASFVNSGTFTKSGGTGSTSFLSLSVGSSCTTNVKFNNSGTVDVHSGTLGLEGGQSAAGSFAVAAGSTLDFSAGGGPYALDGGSSVTGAGTGSFSGGTVSFAPGATYITGATTVPGGSVTFNSPASTGTYTQTGGTLGINLGGAPACTTFGQLNVSGAATLDGTLSVGLTNGCSPSSTRSFQVMTYASHSGTFASVSTPNVNGQPMPVSYFPTNVTVGSIPAVLVSLAVTPANPTVALGATQPFTATGTYSDATTKDLTTTVTWTSSVPATATINTSGVATAVGLGTTAITARLGEVTSPAQTLTVRALNQRIAFVSVSRGGSHIYVMNADGTGQHALTSGPALDATPMFSPGGTMIAFSSSRTGNGDIYLMNADGTQPRRLTTSAAVELDPAWGAR